MSRLNELERNESVRRERGDRQTQRQARRHAGVEEPETAHTTVYFADRNRATCFLGEELLSSKPRLRLSSLDRPFHKPR